MRLVLIIQSVYILVTAVWPLVDIRSFMMVTGPKKDVWLVKTVAVILLCISIGFIAAWYSSQISIPLIILAASLSAGLAAVDIYYVFSGVISAIYLGDALIETGLLICWIFILITR